MEVLHHETFTCPKSMIYGPCGGVEFDGSCEVSEHRCVFVDEQVVPWGAPVSVGTVGAGTVNAGTVSELRTPALAGREAFAALIAARQVVIADFPGRAVDAVSLAECAAIL